MTDLRELLARISDEQMARMIYDALSASPNYRPFKSGFGGGSDVCVDGFFDFCRTAALLKAKIAETEPA